MRRSLEAHHAAMQRADLIGDIVDLILTARRATAAPALRVGVDGFGASGKTILADELAAVLRAAGVPVLRSGIDHFHHPRERRYRNGRSPEAYYADSFDHDAVAARVLKPLGSGGDGRVVLARYDHHAEAPVPAVTTVAEPGSVLVFEGVFCFRPELAPHFDFKILVEVPEAVVIDRARRRDEEKFGTGDEAERLFRERYLPGQRIYAELCDPRSQADVIVENADPEHPGMELAVAG